MKILKRTLAFSLFLASSLHGAVVTNHLLVDFNGTFSGSAYTQAVGEVLINGTFTQIGSPVISGGIADNSSTTGFRYDTTITNLRTQNWIAEAIISFDSFNNVLEQPTLLNVEATNDFRVHVNKTTLEVVYNDGTPKQTTATLPPLNSWNHYALVWDGSATKMDAYVDRVLVGTVDAAIYLGTNRIISFGYRNGSTRGIDGQIDGVAFSTFTGTFNQTTDFRLIPEPSVFAMSGGLCALLWLRRRKKMGTIEI